MHRHSTQVLSNDPHLPQFLPAGESEAEPEEKKVMKVSFPDIDDWIMGDDIKCTGQDQLGDSDIAQKEVDRYLSSIVMVRVHCYKVERYVNVRRTNEKND